jgi:hypothetical protein
MKKSNKKKNIFPSGNVSGTASVDPLMTYEKAFLQINKAQKRGDKSIYLSPEHHQRLTRIVRIIGDDKIPLFAYLNNILEYHFRMFGDMISMEFDEKYKSLF